MKEAPSIFKLSRQEAFEEPESIPEIFNNVRQHTKENIIPPLGLAKPELIESFMQNQDDEDQILRDVADAESYERETKPQTFRREALAHGARAAEGYLGGITSLVNAVLPDLYDEEEARYYTPTKLPTAQDIHEFTKSKTGKYLEPKGEFSKATQETIGDIGSMFSVPGLGALTKILVPIGGQATKQAIKSAGGGEELQEYGKLGFMALSTVANIGNAPQVASNAMNQARNMIPQGLRFWSGPTEQALNRIKNSNWYITGSTPSKAPALHEIERIEKHIQNHTLDAHTAMQLRTDINEARKQLGGFQLNKPVDRKGALRHLDEVDNALLQSMEHYGQVNPKWFQAYTRANEAYRVTQRSRALSEFIEKNAKPLKSEMAKTLFHVGLGAGVIKLPTIAAAAVPIAATAKGVQLMNRMIKSPVLRNHYAEVMRAAATGNAAVLNKSLEKFDKIAMKYQYPEEKEKGITVDFDLDAEKELNQGILD